MELNEETVKKALEHCTSKSCGADFPQYNEDWCELSLMEKALSLIKELTEENERLSQSLANIKPILDNSKADTVRKMQESIKSLFAPEDDVQGEIDKIAKKMLEGER